MLDGRWLAPIRRNIFDPLFCFKNNSPLRSYWKELEETQFLPQEVLLERQWRKLQKLLQYAGKNNEFYRNRFASAGVDANAMGSLEHFQQIPILTKEEVRRCGDSMISDAVDKAGLMHMKTGGSTGKALDIFITEQCSELRNACARRHDRWSGWEVGEPVAAVWGNPHLPVTLKEKTKNSCLSPVIYLDTMHMSEESVRRFADQWHTVKPTLLFGHAHSLFLLCRYLKELGICHVDPRGVISTSMMLLPYERRFIENFLGVKVTDRYGCEEVSLIASQCEMHEGMHINIEHLFVEFITDDGSNAEAGEPGSIIVTDLLNTQMPFIRYKVEDIGVPSAATCSCGRGLPLMASVAGRVADFLKKKNGERVAGISLIENTLTRYKGIDQMQIIQNDFADFTVRVVPGEGFQEVVLEELSSYLDAVFEEKCQVSYALQDAIAQEPSGKYRFSVCRI